MPHRCPGWVQTTPHYVFIQLPLSQSSFGRRENAVPELCVGGFKPCACVCERSRLPHSTRDCCDGAPPCQIVFVPCECHVMSRLGLCSYILARAVVVAAAASTLCCRRCCRRSRVFLWASSGGRKSSRPSAETPWRRTLRRRSARTALCLSKAKVAGTWQPLLQRFQLVLSAPQGRFLSPCADLAHPCRYALSQVVGEFVPRERFSHTTHTLLLRPWSQGLLGKTCGKTARSKNSGAPNVL